MKLIKILTFYLLFIILTINAVHAAIDEEKEEQKSSKEYRSIIFISVGMALGVTADDFFKEYHNELSGKVKEFSLSTKYGVGTKFEFFKGIRICLLADYFEAKLHDGYTEQVSSGGQNGERIISQKMIIKTIPLFLSIEAVPFRMQFRTYQGIGVGAAYSDIRWQENISSTIINDKRTGGLHYDDITFYPAIRVYAGIELGFDKYFKNSFLGCLVFEVNYSYINRKVNIFEKISSQFEKKPSAWNDKFDLITGYLGFNLGITFNFSNK